MPCHPVCARRLAVLSIMQIRSYAPADREICLKIFRSNVPGYFAASEEPEFARFLDGKIGPLGRLPNDELADAIRRMKLVAKTPHTVGDKDLLLATIIT